MKCTLPDGSNPTKAPYVHAPDDVHLKFFGKTERWQVKMSEVFHSRFLRFLSKKMSENSYNVELSVIFVLSGYHFFRHSYSSPSKKCSEICTSFYNLEIFF